MAESNVPSKDVKQFRPVRNGTAFMGMKLIGSPAVWDDEHEPYVRLSDYANASARADFNFDENERLRTCLALQVEQEAKNWLRGEAFSNLCDELVQFAECRCELGAPGGCTCGLKPLLERYLALHPSPFTSETGLKP